MRAVQQRGYGHPRGVLQVAAMNVPEVKPDQALVRVRASSVNPYDWHLVCGEPVLMRSQLGGVRAPVRVVGADFAGVVERVGGAVRGVAAGDEVYGCAANGAFAEFVACPANRLARKPATLTFAQAAAVPMASCAAVQGLRRGGLASGQQVLVIGASGGVGTFAVQLATHAGATVTGVCSTGRLELVRSLGAAEVIDYTAQDPTAGLPRYDLILQLGGAYSPRALRRLLTPRGALVQSYGDGGRWIGPLGGVVGGALLNLVDRPRAEPRHLADYVQTSWCRACTSRAPRGWPTPPTSTCTPCPPSVPSPCARSPQPWCGSRRALPVERVQGGQPCCGGEVADVARRQLVATGQADSGDLGIGQ